MKSIYGSLAYLWEQKRNVLILTIDDFTQGYLSSYFGFVWAILGPLIILVVLTLVFQFGFRTSSVDCPDVPFVVWLTCGMLPWLYFADGLNTGVRSISTYAFIVQKALFRVSFLPIIRLLSIGIIHVSLMFFFLFVLFFYNVLPSIYWIQWFYYVILMYVFLLGVTWFSSALAVFVPDIISVFAIITNIGFWATPIFWNSKMLPEHLQWLLSFNPAYYFVQGYRDTFINQRWFWERPFIENCIFFVLLICILSGGAFVFKRLRPHFADVI